MEQVELEVMVGEACPWFEKEERLSPLTVCANPERRSARAVPESLEEEEVLSPESEIRRVLASLTLSWSTLVSIPPLVPREKDFPAMETGAKPRLGPEVADSGPWSDLDIRRPVPSDLRRCTNFCEDLRVGVAIVEREGKRCESRWEVYEYGWVGAL